MQCPRCLNTDESYFYKGSRGWYCRRCISFGRMMLEEDTAVVELQDVQEGSEEYALQYPLTPEQRIVSEQCTSFIQDSDVLLYCVCGAGKTELVARSIAAMLAQRRKVCFAIPRRQVVLELRERLAGWFPKAKVTAVCGGYTQDTDGDLIVCTTHQLYRYYGAFDLLILDDPDAVPFRGNDVLHGIARVSCRGHTIYLTATPDDYLLEEVRQGRMKCLTLYSRPHGQPLPEPRIKVWPLPVLFVMLIRWLIRCRKHPRMVFVPTVRMAYVLHGLFSRIIPCEVCTGESTDRDEIIQRFRTKKNGIIFSTTVLERGVTVERADICVFRADHDVFDESALIQMAGRAGRSFTFPHGDVLFLCTERSRICEQCLERIQEANNHAVSLVR